METTTQKTVMFLELNSGKVNFAAYSKTKTIDFSEPDAITHTHKEKLYSVPVPVSDCKNRHTALFAAVVEKYSPMFAYTALQTVYAKTAQPYIYQLMRECVQYSASSFETYSDFDAYTAKFLECEQIAQTVKNHTYVMVKGTDGKRHKKEIIPSVELVDTEFGKAQNEKQIENCFSAYDLIQTAKLACVELFNLGLLTCVSDVFNYQSYVYKAINTVIMDNRAYQTHCKYLIAYDKDGNEKAVDVSTVDRQLNRIEKTLVMQSIRETIYTGLKSNARLAKKADDIIKVYDYMFSGEQSLRDIAEHLGKDVKQVMRYKKYIAEQVADRADVKQAVYDCLYCAQ